MKPPSRMAAGEETVTGSSRKKTCDAMYMCICPVQEEASMQAIAKQKVQNRQSSPKRVFEKIQTALPPPSMYARLP